MPNFRSKIQKKTFSQRPLCLVRPIIPLIKPRNRHQSGQKCMGPCNMRKKLSRTFRYFDDVIPHQPENLRFNILLTKMLWTQLKKLFFSILTISWLSKHPGHPPNTPWPPWHPWTLSLAFFGSLWLSQACSGSYCSLNLLKNPFWLTNQSPAAIAFQMCPKWSQSVPEWSKSTFQVF